MRSDTLLSSAQAHMTLSFLVHASAKVGKTTLVGTAPKPLLLLDAEGGTKFLPLRRVYWDPRQGPPPQWDGSWDACVVSVTAWETLGFVYQWLVAGQHSFASLGVDSLTEVQRRAKKNLVGTEQMRTQDWGTILTRMDDLVTNLRDLTEHPTNPLSVVAFITETQMKDGKWRPYLQGRIAESLPYKCDVYSYLFVAHLADQTDPLRTVQQRQLLVGPDQMIDAGERVQGRLGHVVAEPNLERMLYSVYG